MRSAEDCDSVSFVLESPKVAVEGASKSLRPAIAQARGQAESDRTGMVRLITYLSEVRLS